MASGIFRKLSLLFAALLLLVSFQNCGGGDTITGDGGGEPYPGPSGAVYANKEALCPDGTYANIIENGYYHEFFESRRNCSFIHKNIRLNDLNWLPGGASFEFNGTTYELAF